MSDKRFGKFGMLELPLGVQSVIDHPVQAYVKNPLGLRGGLGPELVTNGGFADATGWTIDAAWSIADGQATYSDTVNASCQQVKTWAIVTGKTYLLQFTISGLSAGNAMLRVSAEQYSPSVFRYIVSDGSSGAATLSNGTYQYIFIAQLTTNNSIVFRGYAASGSAFSIDDVSIRQVL